MTAPEQQPASAKLKHVKNLSIAIGIGIIGSAGWDIIKSAVIWGWTGIANLSTAIFGAFTSGWYIDAGASFETKMTYDLVSFCLLAAATIVFFLYFFIQEKTRELTQDSERDMNNSLEKFAKEKGLDMNTEKQAVYSGYRDDLIKRRDKHGKNLKHLARVYTVLTLCLLVIIVVKYSNTYIAVDILRQFEYNLNALGPHLEVSQEKKFRSDFTQMKSAYDFKKIIDEMESINKSHGGRLSLKNRIY